MIHGMIHKTKGKSFFVLISVPPENKNSRAMIHMVPAWWFSPGK